METLTLPSSVEAQPKHTPKELIDEQAALLPQDEVNRRFAEIIEFNSQSEEGVEEADDEVAARSAELFEKIVEPFLPNAPLHDTTLRQRRQEMLDALVAGGAETLHIEMWNLALLYTDRTVGTDHGVRFATRSRDNTYLAEVFTISTLSDGSVLSRCEYGDPVDAISYQIDAHGEELSVYEISEYPDGARSYKKLEGAAADSQMRELYAKTLRAAAINIDRAKNPDMQSEANADARTRLSRKLGIGATSASS